MWLYLSHQSSCVEPAHVMGCGCLAELQQGWYLAESAFCPVAFRFGVTLGLA